MAKFLVLHGPNLNLLGIREIKHYGEQTLPQINKRLSDLAEKNGHSITFLQSNAEHELIHAIHEACHDGTHYILFNPAGLTHTSIVLRDALVAVRIPFIEVHISNIYNREPFRKHSYFADIADGVICGFGPEGYEFALIAAMHKIERNSQGTL
jgi:3-dehydroquinate dehydratase II